ncbi:Transcriptional activator NphR [Burkholderiaceae bacterium]|nr:Transcriptional activator NphR [Burkholderiaceae bacterium]
MSSSARSDHHARVFATPWAGVHGTLIASTRHYGRHWHATYGVGLLEDGAQSSASGRGQVDAFAGDLITSNPGEVHDGRPLGGPTRRWRMLYLDPEVLASMSESGTSSTACELQLTQPVIRDRALRCALQQLFARLDDWAAGRRASSADMLACEESFVRIVGLLMERHTTVRPDRDAGGDLRAVRDRLADVLHDTPSLDALARMVGLSKYQLLRRFEKTHGLPPHAWLLQQRAERARRLIRDGRSLADAAAASGFADQSHLTRVFVRHFGFTPGAWRQVAVGPARR